MFGRRHDELKHKLELIYTALVVRDPGTSLAAEAYDGLRRQVIAAASSRQSHAVQLAEMDVALRRGVSISDLRGLSDQWLRQAGITVIDDPSAHGYFETSSIDPRAAEVDVPAYVLESTKQVIRLGRLRQRAFEVPESIDALQSRAEREPPDRRGQADLEVALRPEGIESGNDRQNQPTDAVERPEKLGDSREAKA